MNDIPAAIPPHLLAAPEEKKARTGMGKDDFMLLLMSQLKYQDPIKPMDHHEFAAQLAQFSQLEQLSNIGTGINNLRTGQGDEAKLQALSMIGKRVQAAGNEIHMVTGNPVVLNPNVKEGTKLTVASIYDGNGKIVREIDLSRRSGDDPILWDGKGQDGAALPSGNYSFRVHGVGANGEAQEVGTELSGRVTGVDFVGTQPVLVIETEAGNARLELGKVRTVNVGEQTTEAVKGKSSEREKPVAKPSVQPQVAPQQAEVPSIDISELVEGGGGLL